MRSPRESTFGSPASIGLKDVFGVARRTQKRLVPFLAVGAVVILVLSFLPTPGWELSWWQWVEPITGIATLFIAIAVWWGEMREEAEEALPKRLTVEFYYEDPELSPDENKKPVMKCVQAYLADKADIRAWGQQIGAQMAQDTMLKFYPDIEQDEGCIKRGQDGRKFKEYTARFRLRNLPAELAKMRDGTDGYEKRERPYVLWLPGGDGNLHYLDSRGPTIGRRNSPTP